MSVKRFTRTSAQDAVGQIMDGNPVWVLLPASWAGGMRIGDIGELGRAGLIAAATAADRKALAGALRSIAERNKPEVAA